MEIKKFKKGDFLKDGRGNIFICNEFMIMPLTYIGTSFCVLFKDGTFTANLWLWDSHLVDYASEKEKQKLLKAIDENGYVWDTEKLEMIDKLKY